MKKLILALGLSAATLGVSANTFKTANSVQSFSEEGKKVEIEATKLPEKITKGIMDANKERKIVKSFQLLDAAGIVIGYEVIVLTEKKEEVFKFDKNGDLLKEVITPNPNTPKETEKK
jgi:hypothetical protein